MAENISDSLVRNLDLSGYSPAMPQPPTPVSVNESLEPVRSQFIRCPLPALWQPSPDALRAMYMGSKIPQFRLFNPSAPTGGGSSTVTESVSISSGGSSGGGSSSGSLLPSSQVVLQVPTLYSGNKFIGTVSMASSFQILSASANAQCRIELYGTASEQSQDVSRAVDVPPPAGTVQNLISDVVLDTSPYQWFYQNRIGANADSPQSKTIYVTVTNIGLSSVAFTVTLQFVPLETV